MRVKRITHIINDLSVGGAERMLEKLLLGMDEASFKNSVISLSNDGQIGENLKRMGILVYTLDMKPNHFDLVAIHKLMKQLQFEKPDIIQTWMYHSDLLGGVIGKLICRIPVIWNIRNTKLHPKYNKLSTLVVVRICALLSNFIPTKIISCSDTAKTIHIRIGYNRRKFIIIPNGIDTTIYRPNTGARFQVRKDLGLKPTTILVGLIARYDPIKDHQNFFAATGIIRKIDPNIHFILCGSGITRDNEEIMNMVQEYDVAPNVHLLGPRLDIAHLTAALDVAVSSSVGEAFSNVIGEAMACAVPCVATDVGDSAYIIGNTGRTVPPHNPQMLANAIIGLLQLPKEKRVQLGKAARERIQDNFEISRVVSAYEAVYQEVSKKM